MPEVRDRDDAGRARQLRPRDALGRPLPYGSAGVPQIPDLVASPLETVELARRLIDEGRASLWVLPAAFLRQLDLEVFASGAVDQQRDKHVAAGAAFTLHLQLFRIPLAVTYQVARRIVDDKALTQLVGIGPDL